MYLWRKTVALRRWLNTREAILQACDPRALAVISRPAGKHLQLEVACRSRSAAQGLVQEFGGRASKLPRKWLARLTRSEEGPPLKVGRRLLVVHSQGHRKARNQLLIPTGAAFGTGAHVTTA